MRELKSAIDRIEIVIKTIKKVIEIIDTEEIDKYQLERIREMLSFIVD